MTPDLKLAATEEKPRSAERQALADAHAAKAQAEKDLESARRAFTRGKDAVAKTAIRMEVAEADMATASEFRAKQLAAAAELDEPAPPATMGRVKREIDDAEAEHAAAISALDVLLKRGVENGEDALLAAEHRIIAYTDAILRSVAHRALADACQAAISLRKNRLLLQFLERPQAVGRVPHLGIQRGVFDDGTAFGGERAWRREKAAKEAASIRDAGFASAAAIRRHLEVGLANIDAGQWPLAPELVEWREAREALLAGDCDYPLPGE
jgi:hypothetical protein